MRKFKATPKFHMEITAGPPYEPGKQITVTCNSFPMTGVLTDTAYDEINRCVGWLTVKVQGVPLRFVRIADNHFVADVEKQTIDNGSVQAVQTSLF
jgi:hypothetical protein